MQKTFSSKGQHHDDENNIINSMPDENFKNMINNFYKKYDNKIGFSYMPNNKLLHEQSELRKRIYNISVFNISVEQAYIQLNKQYKLNKLTLDDDKWNVMNIDRHINYIRIMVELLKISNNELILYKEKNIYGDVHLLDVADKIGYKSKTQKRLLKNLFYIELRNALSHMDYYYKLDVNKKFESLVWYEKIKNTDSTSKRIEHKFQFEDIKSTINKLLIILDIQKKIFQHIVDINAYTLIRMSNE